jgi:hypothetical protein
MRLRNTLLLVFICALVATLGAWTDKPQVDVRQGSPAVPAAKPWNALVDISRRGRRLDGFRPTMTIEGIGDSSTFNGKAISAGTYRVEVVFPHPGYYTYEVRVAKRVAARGTVYAFPPKTPQ